MSTDSDPSSSGLGFKQLDDTNYSICVQRMADALAKKKYWRYAQGTEGEPEFDATIIYADTAAGRQQAIALKAFKKELNVWEGNDHAAAALVRSGISDSQPPRVRGCTTAHCMWKRTFSGSSTLNLKRRFVRVGVLEWSSLSIKNLITNGSIYIKSLSQASMNNKSVYERTMNQIYE
jgi:hypothetical protein